MSNDPVNDRPPSLYFYYMILQVLRQGCSFQQDGFDVLFEFTQSTVGLPTVPGPKASILVYQAHLLQWIHI